MPQTKVYPTLDQDLIQSVMDDPAVSRWLGHGDAAEAFLSPGTVFLAVEQDGEIVGGHALDYVAQGVAQAHNLLTPKAKNRAEIVRQGMCWAFGPGGCHRIVGETEAVNRRAVMFATQFAGMSRLYESSGQVWTGLNIQDWPWRHANWCRSALGDIDCPPDQAVMLGAAARLIRVGAAQRGASLYNEWAAMARHPQMQVAMATHDSARVILDKLTVTVMPDRIEVEQ